MSFDSSETRANGSGFTGAQTAYKTLVEESKQFIGMSVEPYLEVGPDATTGQGDEEQPQTQAVFLFGNPNGKGHVSTASQLERLATELIKRYNELLKGEASEGYQATAQAIQGKHGTAEELPGKYLYFKCDSTARFEREDHQWTELYSTYSSRDRVKAAYSTAIKGNDVVRALGGAWKEDK